MIKRRSGWSKANLAAEREIQEKRIDETLRLAQAEVNAGHLSEAAKRPGAGGRGRRLRAAGAVHLRALHAGLVWQRGPALPLLALSAGAGVAVLAVLEAGKALLRVRAELMGFSPSSPWIYTPLSTP